MGVNQKGTPWVENSTIYPSHGTQILQNSPSRNGGIFVGTTHTVDGSEIPRPTTWDGAKKTL